MRPWYLRWWGIAILGYVAVTATLGIVFLIATHRAPPRTSFLPGAFRAGGLTEAGATAGGQFDPSVPIFTSRDPAIGAPSDRAQLIIVEFSDFQCSFCRQAFPIIREAVTMFGDRGLRYVYRNFPIEDAHADARAAAEAAQCAHAQGKFWAYHDKLFQNAEALDRASLARYAEQIGLDRQRLEVCLAGHEFAAVVEGDYQAGVKLGVKGTPTWFFIPGDDPKKARRVEGVIPRDALIPLLERTLAK